MANDLFRETRENSVRVVELLLPAALDISEFDRLNESVLALIDAQPDGGWVLDLTNTDYMGSAALGLIVNIRQKVKLSGGRLVLCGLSPRMQQLFRTCSLERLFKICRNRPEAVEAAGW